MNFLELIQDEDLKEVLRQEWQTSKVYEFRRKYDISEAVLKRTFGKKKSGFSRPPTPKDKPEDPWEERRRILLAMGEENKKKEEERRKTLALYNYFV